MIPSVKSGSLVYSVDMGLPRITQRLLTNPPHQNFSPKYRAPSLPSTLCCKWHVQLNGVRLACVESCAIFIFLIQAHCDIFQHRAEVVVTYQQVLWSHWDICFLMRIALCMVFVQELDTLPHINITLDLTLLVMALLHRTSVVIMSYGFLLQFHFEPIQSLLINELLYRRELEHPSIAFQRNCWMN